MQPRQRVSPVLVGRDDLLALSQRRIQAVGTGAGHLLFLAGEAGIGKTRLLDSALLQARAAGFRIATAAAFPRDLELAGALLLDLGDHLRRADAAGWPEAGRKLIAIVGEADESVVGDRHRRRRLLVMEVIELIVHLADGGPLALGLEDLHWSDDLSLEVLGHVARRLDGVPLLLIGTYRSDELYPRMPMREWRGRLLSQRLAEEVRLGRLDRAQTSTMASLLVFGDQPPPRRLVDELFRRSDGIPLHVEELLGGAATTDGTDGHVAPRWAADADLPDTLSDAILQRAASLSAAARRVSGAAAVIGRSFDLALIQAVDHGTRASIGRALGELKDRFFIVEAGPDAFDFRHALIRDALEGALDPERRQKLHRRVAEAAVDRPDIASNAFLSAHYELAGMSERAFHHARLAAARAAQMSSHREALDLARRALRTAPSSLPALERAALLRMVATEEAATDDNAAAAASLEEARRILHASGDNVTAAEALPSLVAARHLLGDGLEARVGLIAAELDQLQSRAGAAPDGTRGRLLAAMSAAYMLDRRLDESIRIGEEALELARREGDRATEFNLAATVGSCLLFAGRREEGMNMIEAAATEARAAKRESEAARAYRMLGTSLSMLVEYDHAERWLADGVDYAERTEQWNHRHYMASHLAHVAWQTGDWERAEQLAEQVLADGRGGVTTTITALHVRGFLGMGRGDWPHAEAELAEARRLGEEMHELQRFSPALWGLAEVAVLSGRPQVAVALTELGFEASSAVRDAAYLFPFLVTGTRARLAMDDPAAAERWVNTVSSALLDRSIPGTLPAIDHARGLLALASGASTRAREHLMAAREGWTAKRRWWEAHWAGVDLARALFRANRAPDAAALLGEVGNAAGAMRASPLLEATRDLERRLGARHPEETSWAPLTGREMEVARLIAQGMTNREIATELGIASKTVSAHVEHILARLGVLRRAEIAVWVVGRQAK